MSHEEFNKLLDQILEQTRLVLSKKSKEYSTGQDRLHNFKAIALHKDEQPALSAYNLMLKQQISVFDQLKSGDPMMPEFVSEKIGDIINYWILIWACNEDQLKELREKKPADVLNERIAS